MNVGQDWIDAWKTRAENRRQLLAQRLARQPLGPGLRAIRAQYLKNAQTLLNNRRNWAQAYHKHVEAMAQIVSQNLTRGGGTRTSSSKGSLGD